MQLHSDIFAAPHPIVNASSPTGSLPVTLSDAGADIPQKGFVLENQSIWTMQIPTCHAQNESSARLGCVSQKADGYTSMNMRTLREQMEPRKTNRTEHHSVHLVPESVEVRAARIIASMRDPSPGDEKGQHLTALESTGPDLTSAPEHHRATG